MPEEPTVVRITTPAGDPAWLATSYADVRALFGDLRLGRAHPDPENAPRFNSAALLGGSMGNAATEAEDHQRMRLLLRPAFSPRRIATLEPRVKELVDGLLDDMERAGAPADFHAAFSFPLPSAVICQLLGVPFEDREYFGGLSEGVGNVADGAHSSRAMDELREYVAGLMDKKRIEPGEDVLTDLVRVQESVPQFSSHAAAGLAAGLLFAGHETTAGALDRGLLRLTADASVRSAIIEDPSLLPAFVEEIVRLPNPALPQREAGHAGLPRYAHDEIEVGGVTIAAGDLVVLDQQRANLDDSVFRKPSELNLQRQDDHPHLAFGYGLHYCVGAPLARLELTTAFKKLIERFPGIALAVPAEELQGRPDALTGGLVALPVKW